MRRGTTIHVSSPLNSCDADRIADESERQFGKRARDASYPGYWDTRKL